MGFMKWTLGVFETNFHFNSQHLRNEKNKYLSNQGDNVACSIHSEWEGKPEL
jgi:hypothetical protein